MRAAMATKIVLLLAAVLFASVNTEARQLLAVSKDGSCGARNNGKTCPPGNCCSQFDYCGTGAPFCAGGCQSAYGLCNSAPSTPSSPSATPAATSAATPAPTTSGAIPESKDGACGAVAKTKCTPRNSCSQFGYCGSSTAYTFNCQPGYGGAGAPSPCAAGSTPIATNAPTTAATTAPPHTPAPTTAATKAAATPAATTAATPSPTPTTAPTIAATVAATPAATTTTPTPTATTKSSPTATATPTATAAVTATPAATPAADPAATPAQTKGSTITPTATPSLTSMSTPTPTSTVKATPTATAAPTATPTAIAATPAATSTPSATPTATPVASKAPNATATATPTPTPAATKAPNATATATPEPSPATTVTTGPLCSQTYPNVPFGYTDSTGAKTAALTFDDSPDAEGHTDKVLDALRAAGVKATFYVNGNNYCDANAPPCSTTIARIKAEGHTIASHTLSHPHTDSLTDAQINTEFSALESVVGQSMTEYRLPFGEPFQDPTTPLCGPGGSPCGPAEVARVAKTTTKYGVHVGWTFDGEDFNCDSNVACVTKAYAPFYNSGQTGVVLHHSVYAGTAGALPAELALGKSKGYTFVTAEYYIQQIYGMGSAAVTGAFAACPKAAGNTTMSG